MNDSELNDRELNVRELITGLDACRAASDDLRQPELRAVADTLASNQHAREIHVRIERVDAAVLRSMQDVPLPAGFDERLVSRLRESRITNAAADRPHADSSLPPVVPASSPKSAMRSRRQLLAWSAGVAAAAAAVVAAVIFFRPLTPLESADLEVARQWHDEIAASGEWQTLDIDELDEHSLPSELRRLPLHYRDASAAVGREAYAYDLTVPGGPRATLFVIPQAERAGVPATAPTSPESFTQGLSVAYWQRAGAIYVVVVASDRAQDYRRLLKSTLPAAA